jgi:hypothetical protein
MAYNPPDLREEIRDTLFCLGAVYEYQRLDTDKGHVWHFFLPELGKDIDIYSARFIRYGKKRMNSPYEAKVALMQDFQEKI